MLSELFNTAQPIIGMVHLPALPGAPGYSGDLIEVETHVQADVSALVSGGVNGLLFENFGDAPFAKDKVSPLTVSAMTKVISNSVKGLELPFGINVLRNDWSAALSIAAVTGASFIRVNILIGVYATDQGLIEGDAHSCMRFRQNLEHQLGRKLLVFADVHTKHGTPLSSHSIQDETKDLVTRACVDAVIVTGTRTGEPPELVEVEEVSSAAGSVPVLIGSGVNIDNIKKYSQLAFGFIVGTYSKEEGRIGGKVDKDRVEMLVMASK